MCRGGMLTRISHPNIVSVYDFSQTNGLYYLLMAFVDGLSQRQLLDAHKMTAEQALLIVDQEFRETSLHDLPGGVRHSKPTA